MSLVYLLSDPTSLLLIATALAAFSGIPSIFMQKTGKSAQKLAAFLLFLSTLSGLAAAIICLLLGNGNSYQLLLPIPFGPHLISLDPLSAIFCIPIILVSFVCCIYGIGYRPADRFPETSSKLMLFYGLLTASLLFVLFAKSTAIFLLGWEVMALSAYFVLTTDDEKQEVRNAGTLYIICTHTGTLILFAMFALLATAKGSFILPQPGSLNGSVALATGIFITALLGFGLKAGAMPLHIWLPGAHANAPSHISAIMSGLILKIGVYGLVRMLSFFYNIPLWWGLCIMCIGIISGVAGVVFAIGQHDLKRLLAYHSIENIGIIYIGIGLAVFGLASDLPLLVLLGMGGALLHVINHALFKGLLFLGAGAVIQGVGSKELERMGGLLRQMPLTALFFLIGAVAICGLPPLNGFASEFLIYLGLFNSLLHEQALAAIAVPFLALIGALAVACFVKVFGIVFSGIPRTEAARKCQEPPRPMLAAMLFLTLCCLVIGLVPMLFTPLLDSAVAAWYPALVHTGDHRLATIAPLWVISVTAMVLLLLIFILSRINRRKDTDKYAETWGCGYLAPTSRMQYSASSFADTLVGLFAGILRPDSRKPLISGSFPAPSKFSSHQPETVLERIYLPFLAWSNNRLAPLRQLQHGHLHLYILYILLTLVVLLFIPV